MGVTKAQRGSTGHRNAATAVEPLGPQKHVLGLLHGNAVAEGNVLEVVAVDGIRSIRAHFLEVLGHRLPGLAVFECQGQVNDA